MGSGQLAQARLRSTDDGRPAGPQMVEDLPLGAVDRLLGAEHADVRLPHHKEHRHIRWRDAAQVVDVTGLARGKFQHHGVLTAVQIQQGDGHADLVIEGARAFQHGALAGQHVRNDLLGGGLAVAAGHRHDGRPVLCHQEARHIAQGVQRIPRLQHGACETGWGRGPAEDCQTHAAAGQLVQVVVPVAAAAGQCEEDFSVAQGAGIESTAAQGRIGRIGLSQPFAAGRLRRLRQSDHGSGRSAGPARGGSRRRISHSTNTPSTSTCR